MALIFLFLAFFSAIFGGYIFIDGYIHAATTPEAWASALVGLGFAAIPYLIGKSLSEMVAIRQRHLMMEQMLQQQILLQQAIGIGAPTTPLADSPVPTAPIV